MVERAEGHYVCYLSLLAKEGGIELMRIITNFTFTLFFPPSLLSYLRAGDTYEVSEHENYLPNRKKNVLVTRGPKKIREWTDRNERRRGGWTGRAALLSLQGTRYRGNGHKEN